MTFRTFFCPCRLTQRCFFKLEITLLLHLLHATLRAHSFLVRFYHPVHSVKQQTCPDSYRKLALCKSSAYLLTFLHEVDISNCTNLLFAAMQIRLKLNTLITDFVNWDCTSCTSCTTLCTFSLKKIFFACLLSYFFRLLYGFIFRVIIIGSQLSWYCDFLAAWLCLQLVITVCFGNKYDDDDDDDDVHTYATAHSTYRDEKFWNPRPPIIWKRGRLIPQLSPSPIGRRPWRTPSLPCVN